MPLVVRIALPRPPAGRRPPRRGPRLTEALITRSHHLSVLPGATARRAAAAPVALPAVVQPPAGPVAAPVVWPASLPGTVERAAT
ncbi:hypothetical protein [Micromonospora inyonensis]|uniref:Uncharacterized protein n=1 Tax=Micromonospora inyonensis TaxID=47866 RepID=A0A1C6RSX2_9ACTN|nr:hypothetical protein [Micromonospora inyonensis]SCL20152.1 hypothetical protein GA0074694_2941 [Micromonospora inyonensis]